MSDALMAAEEWRPVLCYEGLYTVSCFGRVYSCRLRRMMKAGLNRYGYEEVRLFKDGRSRGRRVHVLLLESFVGPRPDGQQARHLNGVRTANGLANLTWGSGSENVQDTLRHGRHSMQVKKVCPYDHLLVAPNLVLAAERRGKRECLACRRARKVARTAAKRGDVLDLQQVSDAYYAEIMKEVTG